MKCRATTNHAVLAISLLFLIKLAASCPNPCICKWKYGKQTVECIDKDLRIIPEGMEPATQVLEFPGNNLQSLQPRIFWDLGIPNLQKIHLARCRITSISDGTFKGLINLVELDLSGNLLEAIPSGSFKDCPSLMRLTLSSNPIKVVPRAAFGHLTHLHTLELSRCLLSDIQEGAFQGLYSLEWLHLNENQLTTLKGLKYFPNTLKGVQFQDNPWTCDCHLVEFQKYVKDTNTPTPASPVCTAPQRLAKQNLKTVASTELACLPEISPTTFYLEVSEGRNISLVCHTKATPEAKVSWWFKGQIIQNDTMVAPGVHLMYFIEEGSENKRSELFIFNTNEEDNGTFVCAAENHAGLGQANFTIRVVLKRVHRDVRMEPQLDIVLILMSTAVVTGVLLLGVFCVSVVTCQRNKMRKKRNDSKVTLSNSTKDSLLQDSIDDYPESLKGGSKLACHYEEEMELCNSQLKSDVLHSASPISTSNQARSPSSLKRYNAEQNPDLINGTDGVSQTWQSSISKSRMPNCRTDFRRNDFGLSPLNPINLVGDASVEQLNVNCYKTLPYKREKPGLVCRYSLEAEFIAQPGHLEPYGNLRYTADGYPVRSLPYFQPSTIETCCTPIRWPPCLPANFVEVQENVLMKCVSAQTEEVQRQADGADRIEEEIQVLDDSEARDVSDVKC
ncbi:leucine-rich repeat-containing protein 24-like [Harmonia axyridis]|uniref:leucine-rich repeat-containing protein 24-like n=1 Tax=Harmonia axyridis TaxID=115357 RepID=UPI001E2751BE|nr:leucine-rich repeat-containing protein 24-like [Harmonia axyridis]XP_045480626.1 leucine-rich repeat-containing protein 24-like [Harmonia axyridis]XP_045480627.1 leucine-rich repeat-containing protein 24-like [Harmonia axyridis]